MRRMFSLLLLVALMAMVATGSASAAGSWIDTGLNQPDSTNDIGTLDDGVTSWTSVAPTQLDQEVGRANGWIYFNDPDPGPSDASSMRVFNTDSPTQIVSAHWDMPQEPLAEAEDLVFMLVRYTDPGSFVLVGITRDTYFLVEIISGQPYVDLQPAGAGNPWVMGNWPSGGKDERTVTAAANDDTVHLYDGETLVADIVVSSRAQAVGFGSMINGGSLHLVGMTNFAVTTF